MLGSYLQSAVQLLTRSSEANEPNTVMALARMLLFLILGAAAGFLSALVLPISLIKRDADITRFNPLSLSIFAAAVGFATAKSFAALPQISDRILGPVLDALQPEGKLAASVAASVSAKLEQSFQPVPLVKFEGFLACDLRSQKENCTLLSAGDDASKPVSLTCGEVYDVVVTVSENSPQQAYLKRRSRFATAWTIHPCLSKSRWTP